MKPECPVIYLAGPAVFHPDAANIGRRLRALCRAAGCEGLFPLDAEVPGDAGRGRPRRTRASGRRGAR